jgi:hypothetical protein
MNESEININYSEIAKKHLEMMNTQIYSNTVEENNYVNKNNYSNYAQTSNIYTNVQFPIYFIDFSFNQHENQTVSNECFDNYDCFDLNYKLGVTQSKIEIIT